MDKTPDKAADQLIGMVQEMLAAHQKLGGLLGRKREALRAAQYDHVTEICEQVNERVQQISELEKGRLKLAADLTLLIDPEAARPLRMSELAGRLDEPHRGRLLVLRQQLLDQMRQVRNEASVARRATESLVIHMRGLVQSVGAICTGVSLYDRQGTPPPEARPSAPSTPRREQHPALGSQ